MNLDTLKDKLLNKTLEEAQKLVKLTVRPTKIDGRPTIVTRDYRLDRVNVELENGIIVKLKGLG